MRVLSLPGPIGTSLALLIAASLALCVGYAGHRPDAGRYWDERFSVANVRAVLVDRSLRPANGYYQSLSYLPQAALLGASQALHRRTGDDSFAALTPAGRFTSTGYLLSRLLSVLYGAACLLVVFLIGRRLFSAEAGLAGAFLLAATPWHVQASSMFKPDVLLVLTVLLALLWSLRAVERPTCPRFALAGLGVALALSTKLTGGLAAVPLAVGAALSAGSFGRRALRLLAGAGAALGSFALLNPYLLLYPSFLGRNLDHYSRKAAASGATRLGVWREEAAFLLGEATHGRVLGALALAAAVALAVSLVRSRHDRGRLVERSMFLAFPVAYSLAYAAATPHFKGNNFVVLLPFTSLLAAWALVGLWRRAKERLPLLGRRFAWVPPTLVLVAAAAPAPAIYAYREVVPTTVEQAAEFLARRTGERGASSTRPIYAEAGAQPRSRPARPAWGDEDGWAVEVVPRLETLPPPVLDRAAGEIFPASRLSGEGSDFFWRRLARAAPADVARCSPRPFHRRGPEVIAIAHPPEGGGGDGDGTYPGEAGD